MLTVTTTLKEELCEWLDLQTEACRRKYFSKSDDELPMIYAGGFEETHILGLFDLVKIVGIPKQDVIIESFNSADRDTPYKHKLVIYHNSVKCFELMTEKEKEEVEKWLKEE